MPKLNSALTADLLDWYFKGKSIDNNLWTKVMTKCKDCKDGYYYPLVGPREPCQTCSSTLQLNTPKLVSDVARLFTENLYKILCDSGPSVKGYSTPTNACQTFCVEINCTKDHDQPEPLAIQAVNMMRTTLNRHYTGPIAFEDVYIASLPPFKNDEIYIRTNYQGVSALVSMREAHNLFQFKFHIKVSP